MLLNPFISFHQKVAGVELFYHTPDSYICSFVILKSDSKKITIESSGNNIRDIKELASFIKPNIPICISINGKTILHRKTSHTETSTDALFPGINKDDFYADAIPNRFSIIVRKKLIHDCLDNFQKIGLRPASVCLGPFSLETTFPFLQLSKGIQVSINAGYTKADFSAQEISHFEYLADPTKQDSYMLDGNTEPLSATSLIAYSTALTSFTKREFPLNKQISVLAENEEYWDYKLFLKRAGVFSLAGIFIVLLINTIFYFTLFGQYKEVESKYRSNESLLKQVEKLEQKLGEQQSFLNANGIQEETNSLAFYADRIASTLPQGVRLTNMIIGIPRMNRDKDVVTYSYGTRQIKITGSCNRELDLNLWVNGLKKLNFTEDVAIHQLSKDYSNETQFEIEVLIK